MNYPIFEERSLSAIGFNNFKKHWNEVKMRAMYRDGRHTGQWESYKISEMAEEQHLLTMAWIALGVQPQERIAIMAQNRPRWVYTAYSLFAANVSMVPVYPTLRAEEAAFVLGDSGARYVVVDTVAQAKKLLTVLDGLPKLQKIYVMSPLDDFEHLRVGAYTDLLDYAKPKLDMEAVYARVRETTEEDIACIIYTSGTTGRPKGTMLSNGNFMSQQIVPGLFDLNENDIFLNHLPFCHAFGLVGDMMGCLNVGAQLVISDGIKPEQIRFAMTSIRPTVLMSVPRLFEKIFVNVQQVVSQKPPKVQNLFNGALNVGKEVFDLKNEGKPIPLKLALKYRFAKRITTKVLKQAGLDRVRIAYAGGAPTSRELCYFFQSLGIELYQGYGLTETSPVATVNLPGKNKLGTVGPPIEGVEVKLAEDGEILIRGKNIMKGYFNNPEATAEAIDKDGWFHSGDVGEFDEDGYLKIVDRKKELIITSAGKNIAPLGIESAYNTEVYIERMVVIGEGRRHLVGLVCPNFEPLHQWAKEQNLEFKDDAELAQHPQVQALIESRVHEVNKHFAPFEQVKKVAVMNHNFSPETGELTPTEKVKRKVVDQLYEDVIEALYAKSKEESDLGEEELAG